MTKPLFLYATGTAFFTEILDVQVMPVAGPWSVLNPAGGRKVYWSGEVTDDPFWRLLDERKWDARKVNYPAAIWPMGVSMEEGKTLTINHILSVPAGTPFMLGGYSQGAAVMSKVYQELKPGGSINSRWPDFKGAVLFGNPMRQQDFTAPGVTWSGAWDVPGSTTGGAGAFPNRLSGCDYGLWREYVNHDEIIGATGFSTNGVGWRTAVGWVSGEADPKTSFASIFNTEWLNGIQAAMAIGGDGHMAYPDRTPLGAGHTPVGTKTSYELALEFINDVYDDLNITGILPITDPLINRPWSSFIPA
jgi:hypothetical protein